MRKPRSSRAAFTLTEILVVIVLIAVLAAFLLPAVVNSHKQARVAACKAEIKSLEMAIDAFFNDFGFYPPTGFAFNPATGDFDRAVFGDYSYNEVLAHCLTNRFVRGSGDEIDEFGVMVLDRIKGSGRIIGGAPVNSGPYFDCARSDLVDTDGDGYLELPDPWGNLYIYIPKGDYMELNGTKYNAGALEIIDFDDDGDIDTDDLPDLNVDPLDLGHYHYQRFRFQLISRGEDGWTPGMDHMAGYKDISLFGNPYGTPPSGTDFNPALIGTDTDLSSPFYEISWGKPKAEGTADDINNWSR